jgi:hypothetical protein
MLAALAPSTVGAGRPVIPRAESTALAVGQEVAEPEAGVAVGAETAAVGVAVPAAALVAGGGLLLAPPQAATAREQRSAAPAPAPRR